MGSFVLSNGCVADQVDVGFGGRYKEIRCRVAGPARSPRESAIGESMSNAGFRARRRACALCYETDVCVCGSFAAGPQMKLGLGRERCGTGDLKLGEGPIVSY